MAKQTVSFTPKARLIKILGEHLIKDATVGLLELVKNSYDADATESEIRMISLNKPEAKIIIKDNGCGMDLETFLKKWMNPATGHKEDQKKRKERTRLGRLPLGEKGVGRFAAQQIGNSLKLISKTDLTQQELCVEIDWTKFDDNKADLKDVTIDYKMSDVRFFTGYSDTGTILEISDLKYPWNETDIKKIAAVLKRMKSPFKGANDFNIRLRFEDCPPVFSLYENLELTDILDKAHYKLYGIIDRNGLLQFEYDVNIPGEEKIHREDNINLRDFGNVAEIIGEIGCGGFVINFYHYNKTLDKLTGFNKKDIEELCGISVFRDGMRILPYGELGNDWLKLDNIRIQDNTFIGNDTIIGLVEIDQVENPDLIDKANREGLIENVAYSHFENLVLACVKFLHKEKNKDRPKKEIKTQESKTNIKNKFTEIRDRIEKTQTRIKEIAPDDNTIDDLDHIKDSVSIIKSQVEESVEDLEVSNRRLFHLAGTGLAAERFTHEFSRLVSGANDSLVRLNRDFTSIINAADESLAHLKNQVDSSNPKIKKELSSLGSVLEALKNDIRLLGPLFYIKKVASEKDLSIKEIINNSGLLMRNTMNKAFVTMDVVGDSFNVKMREGSCMQIFVNLIDNSVYWLAKKSESNDRKIKFYIDPSERSVYVSDNGPGVVSRYREKIFDPFFSMKGEEGRGLGLYIIKEILEEKKWDIFLLNKEDFPGLLKGASFKILFDENN